MTAVFPSYPSAFDWDNNPAVVLEYLRILHDNLDRDGWQAFEPLCDCPQLFRAPSGQWETRDEAQRGLIEPLETTET